MFKSTMAFIKKQATTTCDAERNRSTPHMTSSIARSKRKLTDNNVRALSNLSSREL